MECIKVLKKFPLKLWPTIKKDRYLNENIEVYSYNICKQLLLQIFKKYLNKYYGDSFVLKDKKYLKLRNLRIKKKYSRKFVFEKKII